MTTVNMVQRGAAGPARERPRQVAWWLILCCVMVFAMVIIGGVTRLTESGLSITYWRPVTGVIPPLGGAEWDAAFAAYRRTPEYALVNQGMALADFKAIYWWEFIHRVWGRAIGVVFLLPLLWFLARGAVPRAARAALWGLFALGALQGAVGWWMVQSGLVARPDVSHYRLAVHLVVALVIYALMLKLALRLFAGWRGAADAARPRRRWRRHLAAAFTLVSVTIVWGAFTAGADAGFIYNEFPTMGGALIPADLLTLEPAWVNFFDHPSAIQWSHRALATLTLLIVLWLAWRLLRGGRRALGAALAAAVASQYGLGAATVLSAVALPTAVVHQAGAVVLLTLLVAVWSDVGRRPA